MYRLHFVLSVLFKEACSFDVCTNDSVQICTTKCHFLLLDFLPMNSSSNATKCKFSLYIYIWWINCWVYWNMVILLSDVIMLGPWWLFYIIHFDKEMYYMRLYCNAFNFYLIKSLWQFHIFVFIVVVNDLAA